MMQSQEVGMWEKEAEEDDGPPPGWQQPIHTPPPPQPHPPPPPPPPPRLSDSGQLVCGSCRRLLAYQLGTKYVKCGCCQTLNLVLEPDKLGTVKCGGCAVLLMYPYGAPKVTCSSCRFETEIGEHNKRPPWSVQLRGPTPPR